MTAGGKLETYTIRPNAGLSVGEHTATITVAYNNNATAEADVKFKVTGAAQAAPATPPELESKTYNRVTLKAVDPNINGAVAQYSKDGGKTWQDSPVFTGLTPSTKYTFVVRYGAIGNYEASPASSALEVTTEAAPVTTYLVTVNGGTGGGSYAVGANVTITANAAPTSQRFIGWTVNPASVTLANASSATTTFTMPAQAVTVTANFENIPTPPAKYPVTVNNGTGGGSYAAGDTVTITANAAPTSQRFTGWTVDEGGVAVPNTNPASFIMPAQAVTVTANFETIITPPTEYTVTFDAQGGNVAPATMKTTVGKLQSLPAVQNSIYIGVIHRGESKSEILPHLRIIDDELFARAQEIISARTVQHREVPLTTRGQSLLVGNVYCGCCGARLMLSTSGRKYHRKDGTVVAGSYSSYKCYNRTLAPGKCDGQTCFSVEKLDNLVDQIVRIQLAQIQKAPPQALLEKQRSREVDLAKAKVKRLQDEYQQKQRDYQDLRAETLKVIQGTSRFNADLLNSLIDETTAQLKELEVQAQTAEQELRDVISGAEQVSEEYAQLMNWAELYDKRKHKYGILHFSVICCYNQVTTHGIVVPIFVFFSKFNILKNRKDLIDCGAVCYYCAAISRYPFNSIHASIEWNISCPFSDENRRNSRFSTKKNRQESVIPTCS